MADLNSIGDVEAALQKQAGAAWDSVKDEWAKAKPAVEDYLKSGKKLVVGDDGKVDLTPLGDKIRDFGAAAKEKGLALWNEEEPGIAGFLDKNKGGLIAGLLAAIAAVGLGDMGIVGALLIGMLTFAVAGGIMDKGGVLSGLFGGEKKDPSEGAGNGLSQGAGSPAQNQSLTITIPEIPKNPRALTVEHPDANDPSKVSVIAEQVQANDKIYNVVLRGKGDDKGVSFDKAYLVDPASGAETPILAYNHPPVLPLKNGQIEMNPQDYEKLKPALDANIGAFFAKSQPAPEQPPAAQHSSLLDDKGNLKGADANGNLTVPLKNKNGTREDITVRLSEDHQSLELTQMVHIGADGKPGKPVDLSGRHIEIPLTSLEGMEQALKDLGKIQKSPPLDAPKIHEQKTQPPLKFVADPDALKTAGQVTMTASPLTGVALIGISEIAKKAGPYLKDMQNVVTDKHIPAPTQVVSGPKDKGPSYS